MRAKSHRPMPVVQMQPIKIDQAEYLLITVRKDATDFIVDNAMQYLVYKVPAYENWVNDDILQNPFKLMQWLDKYENSDQYRTSGCKLPDGEWQVIGKADKNGFDNYVREAGINPETTLVLKKIDR